MYSYTFFIALFYAIPFKTPRRKRPYSTFVGFSYNAHAHQLQLYAYKRNSLKIVLIVKKARPLGGIS